MNVCNETDSFDISWQFWPFSHEVTIEGSITRFDIINPLDECGLEHSKSPHAHFFSVSTTSSHDFLVVQVDYPG